MSGFPKLIPAFTAQIPILEPLTIGSARSGGLTHVPFVTGSGSLRSEPGYPIAVDAVFEHGSDTIRADTDLAHVRLEVASVMRDRASGGLLKYDYTGVIGMGGAAGKVLTGQPDAATTEFGEVFTHIKFESGDPALAAMSRKIYVGSGRFIIEAGKPVIVEYKISEVTA